MKRAVTLQFGGLSSYKYGVETYDPNKLGLGALMMQSTGATNADTWAGPLPIAIGRPMEASTAIAVCFPWAMQWSNSLTSRKDWIFFADNTTAAATRRIVAYEYDRLTGSLTWKGFITVTFPAATTKTIRALRMTYDKHTAGTVAVSGTAVTGTGSTWLTNRACVGNRIGFGSTDPAQIAQWYEISAIASDGSLTLTTSAGTITAGTPYVIEDLRAVIANTDATTTSGGLVIVKGLRYENFNALGTAIPAATTADNLRASYWLKSAATVTETVAGGLGLQAKTDFQTQMCWLSNGTTTLQLFKFNIRAALTLAGGADTTAFQFSTAVSAALTGTASQANNGRVANLGHGPGAGVDCFYFTTTTRIYRSKALSTIVASDSAWLSGGDSMTEVPPGGVSTVAASSLLNSIEYASNIDRFVVPVNATTTPFRDYITQYRTDGGQMDRQIGCDTRQINQSAADGSITASLTKLLVAFSVWVEAGLAYFCSIGTAVTNNIIYVLPLAADWDFAASTNNRLILPQMDTSDAASLVQAFMNFDQVLGGTTGKNLGMQTEPSRLLYRTSGITDDSGAWTALDSTGSMTGVAPSVKIQFAIEFRTIGFTCVSPKIHSVGIVYNDLATDSHYRLSQAESSLALKQFAWRHATAFGGTVPALRVRIYDDVTGGLLVDDNTTAPTGTWERSTDGVTYAAWTNTDKGNETTYVRYTPASLADNVKVRPVLTEL